jgi:hypothetical protein
MGWVMPPSMWKQRLGALVNSERGKKFEKKKRTQIGEDGHGQTPGAMWPQFFAGPGRQHQRVRFYPHFLFTRL